MTRLEKELGTEFIPDLYDKAMDNVFNDNYYQAAGEEEEEDVENHLEDIKLLNDKVDDVGRVDATEEGNAIEKVLEDTVKWNWEKKAQDEGYETWHCCDNCYKPIGAGKFKFDA